MTDGGRIKPTANFSHLLRRISAEMRTHAPSSRETEARDRYVAGGRGQPEVLASDEAWNAVVASSLQFWSNDPGPKDAMRRVVAAELVQALDGLEGLLATGEAAALLEDHRRLQHGFDLIHEGSPPPEVKEFLGELQSLVADWTREFVEKLKEDLLGSKETTVRILDEDARSCAIIIFDSLSRRQPIDRQVLDGAIQTLRTTLSQGDYRTQHTGELDVLAKRLEWLHAAVELRSPVLESR
jgi:hypothetical protein